MINENNFNELFIIENENALKRLRYRNSTLLYISPMGEAMKLDALKRFYKRETLADGSIRYSSVENDELTQKHYMFIYCPFEEDDFEPLTSFIERSTICDREYVETGRVFYYTDENPYEIYDIRKQTLLCYDDKISLIRKPSFANPEGYELEFTAKTPIKDSTRYYFISEEKKDGPQLIKTMDKGNTSNE